MTRQDRERLLKATILDKIRVALEQEGQEVLQTGPAQLDLPTVDNEGNELFVSVKLVVPHGTRDGIPYDAYAEAEFFQNMKPAKKGRKPKEAEKTGGPTNDD